MRVGEDVLRTRRKEDESVQPGLVERSSGEGDATGRTTLRAPYSSGDMVSTAGETRRWWTDARELDNKASQLEQRSRKETCRLETGKEVSCVDAVPWWFGFVMADVKRAKTRLMPQRIGLMPSGPRRI